MVIMLLVFVSVLFLLFTTGFIFLINKKKIIGSVLLGIPLVIILGIIGLYLWFFNETTPKSLSLFVKQQGENYVLHGKWNDRLDYYSFKTDFLVFYTPNNKPIKIVKRNKGDWKPNWYNFDEDIPNVSKESPYTPANLKPQLFDITAEKNFDVVFSLPKGINLDQVTIQYVHVRAEPMGSLTYWIKTYNKE